MCWFTCWLTAQPTIKVKKNNQLAMGACDEKGEGGKTMAMGIRVAGDEEGERDEATTMALATRVESCEIESNFI